MTLPTAIFRTSHVYSSVELNLKYAESSSKPPEVGCLKCGIGGPGAETEYSLAYDVDDMVASHHELNGTEVPSKWSVLHHDESKEHRENGYSAGSVCEGAVALSELGG